MSRKDRVLRFAPDQIIAMREVFGAVRIGDLPTEHCLATWQAFNIIRDAAISVEAAEAELDTAPPPSEK